MTPTTTHSGLGLGLPSNIMQRVRTMDHPRRRPPSTLQDPTSPPGFPPTQITLNGKPILYTNKCSYSLTNPPPNSTLSPNL